MASATQVVTFAAERASVPLPDAFRVTTSDDGLVATFGAESDHTVELSLLGVLPGTGGAKAQAIGFIESQGKKKSAKVSSDGERAVFSERGETDPEGRQGVSSHALADRRWKLCFHDDADGTASDDKGIGRVSWRAAECHRQWSLMRGALRNRARRSAQQSDSHAVTASCSELDGTLVVPKLSLRR